MSEDGSFDNVWLNVLLLSVCLDIDKKTTKAPKASSKETARMILYAHKHAERQIPSNNPPNFCFVLAVQAHMALLYSALVFKSETSRGRVIV